MNKTLIDNSVNLKMVDKLKECFSDSCINTVRIATGYWDIPGMALLIDSLKAFVQRDGAKIKLIIGKDPYVYANMMQLPKYKDKHYPEDFIRVGMDELADNLKEEYRDTLQFLLDNCKGEQPKIDIHIYKTNNQDERQFFHSKCYIFTSADDDEKNMYAIVGSSNFTLKGMEGNAELNVLETDPYMINAPLKPNRKGHITWFEEKWQQSDEWTQEFLEQVLKISKPVQKMQATPAPFSPYELYIKLLQLQFGDVIDKNLSEQIEAYLPANTKKLSYQIEAVKRCIGIMHEHGGFMLADVVGLGKTIVGTLIIKRFLTMPEDDGRERKVLVITPPAIQSGWKKTIDLFDKDSEEKIAPCIDFITTGRITNVAEDEEDEDDDDNGDTGNFKGTLQYKNYGFIVIDESHKFRNSGTLMYKSLDELIENIGSNLYNS